MFLVGQQHFGASFERHAVVDTVEQALHAYTTAAAYASYEEDDKGMLRAGMLADFVLLDRDITAIPAETIPDTQVLKTIVGGNVVHSYK